MEGMKREAGEKAFLPIGSTVVVKGSVKKLMVVARAVYAKLEKGEEYFDYGACTYPEGLMGDNILYFKKEDIAEVVYRGYEDADEERMLANISLGLERIEKERKQDC